MGVITDHEHHDILLRFVETEWIHRLQRLLAMVVVVLVMAALLMMAGVKRLMRKELVGNSIYSFLLLPTCMSQ